ncbi:MAG: NUDIX domain-containing protein [Bacteroidia bacterium]|nr:MAG: NUDIX domain-containing protein [Bacteroidia bacterium]
MMQVSTRLLAPGSIELQKLNYVVMGARYQEKWIFVRHRERSTWEMVSGHIEAGETADQAAIRELSEEAGVVNSSLKPLCDYEVEVKGKKEYGRFYGVEVSELDPRLEHEIEELVLADGLPEALTYPEVHVRLFQRALEHFGLS